MMKFMSDRPQQDGETKRDRPEKQIVACEHVLERLQRISKVVVCDSQADG
jgi:hypothetical protein